MPAPDTAPAHPASPETPAPPPHSIALHLRLLATSDLHAHVLAWNYYSDTPSESCGLARTAALIARARSEAANCLLFDNGDFLNGNPLGDFAAESLAQPGGAAALWPGHPMIAAMNQLGYDGATLGNHDFSAGIGLLTASLAQANFPVVAANIQVIPEVLANPESAARSTPLFTPYALLDRHFLDADGQSWPLRIGIIGFLPPQTLIWEQRHLKSHYQTSEILATARRLVPELRARGADVVIALSHSGIDSESTGNQGNGENVSFALAALAGIDATIAGHTHLVFPTDGPVRQAHPLVMPGFFGSHLGVIDLHLQRGATGWRVVAHQTETRPIAGRVAKTGQLTALVASVPEIDAAARPCHDALRRRAETVIGQTPHPLHSYFALIQPTAALHLVAEAQIASVRATFQGGDYAALPLLAAVAPFKAGGRGGAENYTDVPAGPLTARHAADLYVHPNSIVALRLRGRDIALWLERAVSLYHRIQPGAQDAPLIDPDFPSFNFDMIYGLTCQINLSAQRRFDAKGRVIHPRARRITDLRFHGQPLRPGAEVVLATNSYRSSGGSGFAGTTPDRVIYEGCKPTREVLENHIRETGIATPPPLPGWRFAPMPGTTVLFDSAPRALDHLSDVANLRIEPVMPQANGFHRFRLHL